MSIGSPFDPRTAPLNVRRQWRQWSATFAASAYAPHIDIEYNAIRNAAALIDVSPLSKYRVSGPDATQLIDRVVTRDVSAVEPGRVEYQLTPQEFHFNPAGTLHGGVMATIVDSAMSCAIWSLLPAGIGWTTMEMKMGLVRTVTKESGRLVCVGTPISVGQRSGAAEARVHDAQGKLCAYASTTCMIFR